MARAHSHVCMDGLRRRIYMNRHRENRMFQRRYKVTSVPGTHTLTHTHTHTLTHTGLPLPDHSEATRGGHHVVSRQSHHC